MATKRSKKVVRMKKPKGAGAEAGSVVKLAVKPGLKLRGAREAWYARLNEFNGKTEQEFVESATKKPPALTKAGTGENPRGWLRYFQRSGVLELKG